VRARKFHQRLHDLVREIPKTGLKLGVGEIREVLAHFVERIGTNHLRLLGVSLCGPGLYSALSFAMISSTTSGVVLVSAARNSRSSSVGVYPAPA